MLRLSTPAAAQVNYKDREQMKKARDAADVPGAARYLLRSAPEMVAAAAQVKWQDFLNVVELQTLVRPAQTSGLRKPDPLQWHFLLTL